MVIELAENTAMCVKVVNMEQYETSEQHKGMIHDFDMMCKLYFCRSKVS
jgi:hypothetical protein